MLSVLDVSQGKKRFFSVNTNGKRLVTVVEVHHYPKMDHTLFSLRLSTQSNPECFDFDMFLRIFLFESLKFYQNGKYQSTHFSFRTVIINMFWRVLHINLLQLLNDLQKKKIVDIPHNISDRHSDSSDQQQNSLRAIKL